MIIVIQTVILIDNYINHDKLKIIGMSGGGTVAAPPGGPLTATLVGFIFGIIFFFRCQQRFS